MGEARRMTTKIETRVALEATLFEQAERLAQQLNVSLEQLFETAIEEFVRSRSGRKGVGESQTTEAVGHGGRMVNRGDIYWVQLDRGGERGAGIRHPHVVVQEDVLNHSRIKTVVACALTSNVERINLPGNVLLEAGEGNLSRQSVVEVAKVSTVGKAQLGGYIGSLSEERIGQILAGMRFLEASFFGGGSV
jgi:mRNA interferase MazF